MLKSVMFDFSGTLFRCETTEQWLRATLAEAGHELEEDEFTDCVTRLEEAGALPGGALPRKVPPRLAGAWRDRDLSAEHHKAAYVALARQAPLPAPEFAERLYDRHRLPAAWQPYPDTLSTLQELRRRGIPVAVVSNIGWDLRPVFREHGVEHLVDAYVLSCEVGSQKPDPAIFMAACHRLGAAPEHILMVGDDHRADAGAAALGCTVHLVDHLPVNSRPAALNAILELFDQPQSE